MEHCLFLQGDSQIGKSTLLARNLKPYLQYTGGFFVQRLTESGAPRGFCLCAVSDPLPELTVPLESAAGTVFMRHLPEGTCLFPEVFGRQGAALLSEAALKGKRLILLDEIGGIELLQPEFHRALYRVLESGMPCIGVIKSPRNKAGMESRIPLGKRYGLLYDTLAHDIVNRFGGRILTMTETNCRETQDEAEQFLKTSVPAD